jgi:hypothetical protein
MVVIGVGAITVGVVGASVAIARRAQGAAAFVLYILVALFYVFPGMYLRRYAAGIRNVMNLRASEHLEAALEAQKAFWRLMGILTAIILGLYVVLIVVAVAGIGIYRLLP